MSDVWKDERGQFVPCPMRRAEWFFAPGTERRVPVLRATGFMRFQISCQHCEKPFLLHEDHGVTVERDGALSTDHAFQCPHCRVWVARLSGGVLYAAMPSENVE